jgi:hypothetical protein
MKRLAGVLVLGALVLGILFRIWEINYNGPFLDEAIYIVQGKKVFDGTWQSDAPFSWIGGMPLFYPPLSAFAYGVGGIVGTRLLNVALFGIATFFVFKTIVELSFFKGVKILNTIHGGVASLLFAFSPVSFWLSRLAIYDMLCITFLCISLYFLQRARVQDTRVFYLISGILLSISFLAKYSTLIILPFLSLVIFLFTVLQKRYNALLFFIGLFVTLLLYFSLTYREVYAFFTGIAIDTNDKFYSEILSQYFEFTWLWYGLSLIGIYLLKKRGVFPLLLFLLSFSPLIMHLVSNNTAAVYQDTFFTFIFLLPLTAAPFVFLIRKQFSLGVFVLIVSVACLALYTKQAITPFEQFWPDYTKSSLYLKNTIEEDDILLLEAGDSVYLDLYDTLDGDQVVGPFVFSYSDLEGKPAYKAAISDAYFDYIQLDKSSAELSEITESLLLENYTEVFQDETITIYKKK